MGKLAELRVEEGIRLDPDRISALYREFGEARADAYLCRTMEEVAAQLRLVSELGPQGGTADLSREARSLRHLAMRIGMRSVARVAGDVERCARGGDAPALAATLARLGRIGERSLTAIWDLQDVSL